MKVKGHQKDADHYLVSSHFCFFSAVLFMVGEEGEINEFDSDLIYD